MPEVRSADYCTSRRAEINDHKGLKLSTMLDSRSWYHACLLAVDPPKMTLKRVRGQLQESRTAMWGTGSVGPWSVRIQAGPAGPTTSGLQESPRRSSGLPPGAPTTARAFVVSCGERAMRTFGPQSTSSPEQLRLFVSALGCPPAPGTRFNLPVDCRCWSEHCEGGNAILSLPPSLDDQGAEWEEDPGVI